MLSRSEWDRTAERSAASTYGSKHYKRYAFRRYLPQYAGLALLALGGFAVWWSVGKLLAAWHGMTADAPANASAKASAVSAEHSAPVWLWVPVVLLLVASVYAFRPGRRADRLSLLVVKILGLGTLWLGLGGLTLSFLL